MGARKILIVGGPSAGKTTLARALARRLELPLHELDPIAFADENFTKRPAAERTVAVQMIFRTDSFVCEGAFLGWTHPIFEVADVIIWLDPPLVLMMWRHLVRHRRRGFLWLTARWRFQVLWFLRSSAQGQIGDPTLSRRGVRTALRSYPSKVWRYRCTPALERVVARLEVVCD